MAVLEHKEGVGSALELVEQGDRMERKPMPTTSWMIPIVIFLIFALQGNGLVFGANAPGSPVGPYQGFGYEWENNTLGMDRRVPPPWKPVSVKGQTLEVWGRSYVFGSALFPMQITSQGKELLAAPMRLRLQANGRALADTQVDTKITDQAHDDRVELTGRLQNADVRVLLRTSLEFDGFLRFDLTLTPTRAPVSLQAVVIEIPFHSQVARFYSRFFLYDFHRQLVDPRDLLRSAGRISQSIVMPFNHHVWIGNHQVGAEFSAETNQNWSNQVLNRSIEIVPTAAHTVLRLNLVDKPVTFSQDQGYSFALYITPIRPMSQNWRASINGAPMQTQFEPPQGYTPRLWTFYAPAVRSPNMVPLEYDSLAVPPSAPKQRAIYDQVLAKAHHNKVRFIPYSSLMWWHGDIPELQAYWKYWVMDLAQRGTRIEGWQPSKRTLDAGKKGNAFEISLYSKSIQDFLIWQYVQAAEKWNQDGVYFDVAAGRANVVNPNAGRLVPDKGKMYQPVFSVREFHKRLYKAVKARQPDFLITQHHGKTPILYSGFSDIIYSGEALNLLFLDVGSQQKKLGKLSEDRAPYAPDYSRIPDDFWRATYGSQFGFVPYLLPQIFKWRASWGDGGTEEMVRAQQKQDGGPYTRILLSRALVLGLPVMRLRLDVDVFDKVMRGFEQFGGLVEPLTFIGPEEAERIHRKANTSRLLTSAYLRPETRKMVLIIANWTPNKVSEALDLNFSAMAGNLTAIAKVTDLEGGAPPSHSAQSIKVELPGNDFRVLMIE